MTAPAGCQPGQVLDGRYLIVRKIAAGGMSTVFEAKHVKIGRTVAIKILHPAMASDPDLVARFLKEARAVGTFGHPNIVASTDFGELPGHIPYLVLEYLDGRTLGHEIKTSGPLALSRALHIASQIASALGAAHARGVVHRDLTSENVFLTRVGADPDHVKVLDFGISKFLAPLPVDDSDQADAAMPGDANLGPTTRRGLTMGTPEFMAPEQISDPSSVDARVDIYALGVILHYMLAGQTPYGTPFGRLPAHVLLTRILVAPIPAIERSDIPAGVRALVAKALAKNVDERFSSMREMEETLAGLIAAGEGPPSPAGPGRARRLIAYGGAALIAVFTAAALLRARVSSPGSGSSVRHDAGATTPMVRVAAGGGGANGQLGSPTAAPAVERAPASGENAPPPAPDTAASGGDRETISNRRSSRESSGSPRVAVAPRRAGVRRGGAAKTAGPAPEETVVAPPADNAVGPPSPLPVRPAVPPAAPDKPARTATTGSVDPARTREVVRSRLPEIQRCYDRGKMDDPELKGRVTVRIHIGPRGAVTADEIESSSLASSAVERCILDAVRGWKFPSPAGGTSAVISYPFNLR